MFVQAVKRDVEKPTQTTGGWASTVSGLGVGQSHIDALLARHNPIDLYPKCSQVVVGGFRRGESSDRGVDCCNVPTTLNPLLHVHLSALDFYSVLGSGVEAMLLPSACFHFRSHI